MSIQQFVQHIQQLQIEKSGLQNQENNLLQYRDDLEKQLNSIWSKSKTRSGNPIEQQMAGFKENLLATISQWSKQWSTVMPMKALSERFEDKIIFLVFGKVNSGKSAFVNFIAEQFEQHGLPVQRFILQKGQIKPTTQRFVENATEATSQIQGVELANQLVLLDSPGLHSVTEENGQLSKKFADSADAILWLTNSNAPAQVQELAELKNEMAKNKPVLPVITRSDKTSLESFASGLTKLQNKSQSDRELQEKDVIERASNVLGTLADKLVAPVSVSVRCYLQDKEKEQDAESQSGIKRIAGQMKKISADAQAYKINKAKQQMLNFLDENIAMPLQNRVQKELDQILRQSTQTIEELQQKKSAISNEILSLVLAEARHIVHKHKDNQDYQGMIDDLRQVIESSFNKVFQRQLNDYAQLVEQANINLSPENLGSYEEETKTITWRIRKRGGNKGKLGGALLGAAVGFVTGGPAGAIAGGIAGSLAGSSMDKSGGYKTRTEIEFLGINAENMKDQTEQYLQKHLPEETERSIDNLCQQLEKSIEPVKHSQQSIETFLRQIEQEKQTLSQLHQQMRQAA